MGRKIVLAMPNRSYAARLAEYLRETEPEWETAAFTHDAALRMRLQEAGGIDILLGCPPMLRQNEPLLPRAGRVAALVEERGEAQGVWPEIYMFQALPSLTAALRGLLSDAGRTVSGGCRLLTVFSAAAGTGKTSAALNIVRQAGERGWRTFYLNLEMLNATSRLFGKGDPDSLSRLLYGLQTEPERFAERLQQCARHQPYLRTDFLDAPDHPGERAAMSSELLTKLVDAIRETGRYDLIVADPDSGVSNWHLSLLGLSDRIIWLVTDDWQCMVKSELLLSHWRTEAAEWLANVSFIRNKGQGAPEKHWNLPSPAAGVLPYIAQWKGMEQPGHVFAAAPFSGAVDRILDSWGWNRRGKEDKLDGSVGAVRRGIG